MLGCIIEDFCHCPASSCLGHQQTHPQAREDSSCSFHTRPSRRQHGEGGRELQPATSKQPASLGTRFWWPKTRETPKTSVLLFFLNHSILYKSHWWASSSSVYRKKKSPVIFNRRRLWQLSKRYVFLHTNNEIADLFFFSETV